MEVPTQVASTVQDLAALILQCQTWVELAQTVGQSTKKFIKVTNQMTTKQRQGIVHLLVAHLCQTPANLNHLAWVPNKLRDKALQQLTFTIRRIGGAANVLDACLEHLEGCKVVSEEHLGTRNELLNELATVTHTSHPNHLWLFLHHGSVCVIAEGFCIRLSRP